MNENQKDFSNNIREYFNLLIACEKTVPRTHQTTATQPSKPPAASFNIDRTINVKYHGGRERTLIPRD